MSRVTGLLTLFLLFKLSSVYCFTTKTCSGKPANIIFVLDSSSSIWIVDYKEQLAFVRKLVNTFDIGPHKSQVRIGAITFSNSAHLEFTLGQYTNPESLSDAILNIPYRTGSTNTASALDLLRKEIEPRIRDSTVPYLGIVITDGLSTNPKATRHEAKRLHKLGISVYAIGVGQNYHLKELKAIASDPTENVFQVSSYSDLESITQSLNVKTCKDIEITTTTTTTPVPTTITTTTSPAPTTTTTTRAPTTTTTTLATTTTTSTTTITPVPTTTTTTTSAPTTPTTTASATTTTRRLERLQRDETSSVSFGYDLLSMGSNRARMISEFVNSLLPYTGYGNFGVVSYSYCPEIYNVPVTSLMNSTGGETIRRVPTRKRIPDLSDVVSRMRHNLHSNVVRNFPNGMAGRQAGVIFVDPAVTAITPRLIRETNRLKNQGFKLFVINVGQVAWSQPRYLYTMSSQPYQNYMFRFPTYTHLLHRVRHTPFQFRALCNGYVPSNY